MRRIGFRHARARKPHGGFTLIEIMVVMLIIGLIVSLATLSTNLGGRNRDMAQALDRLTALSRLAAEEAVLQGQQLALGFEKDRYTFYAYAQEGWQPLADDLFRSRALPQDIKFGLQVEGRTISPESLAGEGKEKQGVKGADGKEKEQPQPQVMFLSSGELTPFVATLEDQIEPYVYIMTGQLTGQVDWTQAARKR